MRRRAERFCAVAVVALVAAVGVGGAATPEQVASGGAGWQGLLGGRPAPQLGRRWIVVLRAPSLADRLARAGGAATEAQMRSWTATAGRTQVRVLAELAFAGAAIEPEHSYVRVLNGIAASFDARLLPTLERSPLVAGVYPVRAAYPAAVGRSILETPAFAPGSGRRPELTVPGVDGEGVTVALLDTGIDRTHPFLQGALEPGIDVVDPTGDASARQNPTEPGRPERHATELAGLVAGFRGPAGLRGIAPGATILPIRVAGWQPDADGGVSIYSRTDQLLAGLEAAVDPDRDGDAHDGARIALVGLVEPFASFPDGPLARGSAGALTLGTLVVAPSGNDGAAGPGFGSVGAPAGVPAALGVAASDARRGSPSVHVMLRAGLQPLVFGRQPLGGAVGPREAVSAPVVVLPRRGEAQVDAGNALDSLFDRRGFSRVAGSAALLPRGPTTPEAVRELAAAGVRAILVDGPVPAGSIGVDEPIEVPIVGIPPTAAGRVRLARAAGIPVELSVGASAFDRNTELGSIAAFSSTGLAYDGRAKPELAAPGVGLATSEPGRTAGGTARYGSISGSSAAAALVAGAAALLADARPDLDAAALRGALVASARRTPGRPGLPVGIVDPVGATAVELVADPPTAALGALRELDPRAGGSVRLRNVSTRPLRLRLTPAVGSPVGVTVRVSREQATLLPGRSLTLELRVAATALPRPPGALGGAIRVRIERGASLRIPWTAAVPETGRPAVTAVSLSETSFRASDRNPAVLELVAGRVDGTPSRPQLLPLERLELVVWRAGRRLGTLVRLRDVLPGRYAFGVTGRGPGGGRLPRGAYTLRVVGVPVGAGAPTVVETDFRLVRR